MYQRIFNLPKTHSFFLFGARATGKTELLKQHFPQNNAVMIDLLDPELSGRLSAYPSDLLQLLLPEQGSKEWVVIDEVQKVPQLLELVHQHF